MAYTTTSNSSNNSDSSGVKISVALLGMILALGAGYIIGGIFPFKQWNSEPPKPEIVKSKPDSPKNIPSPQAPPHEEKEVVYKVPIGESPAKGVHPAKVTIIEYSDFQCSFCSRVIPTMKKLLETYPNDVRLVFKQNPLPFHAKAGGAAEAALAAHEQGKFWEMHDKLFENQQNLDRSDLEKYAQELGLDMDKFKAALDSGKFKAKIDEEKQEAAQFGAQGTPSFFINGRKIVGAQPYDNFQKIVDEEIINANEKLKAGISLDALYAKLTENGIAKAAQPAPSPAKTENADDSNTVYQVIPGNGPSWGSASAKVTMIVFSDFQCPFCSRVLPSIEKIKEKYADQVRIVWRNYPLPFHAKAGGAAEAALAAHEQGKFWEMHDKLFQNQQNLDRSDLEKYAQELGLDMDKFKAALDSGKFKADIQADINYGNSIPGGGMGTPTFFINGRKIAGAYPFEEFDKLIQKALSEK